MTRFLRSGLVAALLAACPSLLLAQHAAPDSAAAHAQHGGPAGPAPASAHTGQPGAGHEMGRPMMDPAADRRLDSLVAAMHSATGAGKVAAMERVLDELLAQRAAMQRHMHHMMQMMHGNAGEGSGGEHQH